MNSASSRQRWGRSVRVRVVVGLVLVLLLSPLAIAQQPVQPRPAATPPAARPALKPKVPTPEEQAIAAERDRVKQLRDAINKAKTFKIVPIQRSGQIPPADQTEVDQFLTNYIDVMTSPVEATEAPLHRQNLRREVRSIGNPVNDQAALQYVNKFLLVTLSGIAYDQPRERRTPHARLMCVLALGDLNVKEPTSVGGGTVQPMPEALSQLHRALKEPDMAPAVRVAALAGIVRHAKYGIADKALEKQLVADMTALVKQKTPPEGETPDGQHWMRRQAMEILALLKQPGPANEVVLALAPIVLDKTEPTNVRLDAMRALGQFKVPANTLGELVTAQLGEFTLEQLRNEVSRRALRLNLQSLALGLRGADGQSGIVPSLSGQDKKHAEELSRRIANLNSFIAEVSQVADPTAILATEMLKEADSLQLWLEEEVLFTEETAVPVNTP
jgi:hypothetical protein